MKRRSLLIRGIVSALLIQAASLVGLHAQQTVPSSVSKLDSAAHSLVEGYQSELRRHGHRHKLPRNEARFLEAAKNLETSVHSLHSVVEKRQGRDRAESALRSVLRSSDILSAASRDVRLNENNRRLLSRVRSLVSDVDHDSRVIYSAASPRRQHDRHDHHHDDRGRDDGPRRPGIFGKIFR